MGHSRERERTERSPWVSMSFLPLPCLTPCGATASHSSGCGMRVMFQGPRQVLLGLDITRLGRRLRFSSLTLWAVYPHPHLLWFCHSWTTPFYQLTAYDTVAPFLPTGSGNSRPLLIPCFLVSCVHRDSACVPDPSYLTALTHVPKGLMTGTWATSSLGTHLPL